MLFRAKAKYIRFSPHKLRPLVDVVRGKDIADSLNWLATHKVKRVVPIKKLLESAIANAKSVSNIEKENLMVKDIRVDQGPTYKYFKPSARGVSSVLRKRFSHISIVLVSKDMNKEV